MLCDEAGKDHELKINDTPVFGGSRRVLLKGPYCGFYTSSSVMFFRSDVSEKGILSYIFGDKICCKWILQKIGQHMPNSCVIDTTPPAAKTQNPPERHSTILKMEAESFSET